MWRRKKRKNNNIVYIVVTIVLFVIWFIFYNIDWTKDISQTTIKKVLSWTKYEDKLKEKNDDKKYYANSTISGTWKLVLIPYNIKIWTKYKLEFNWKTFFAKSDKYLLDDYSNANILFSWEIIWFSPDNTPVLNITNIENSNKEQVQDEEKQEDRKIYFHSLVLDLTWTDYLVYTGSDFILIYKTWTDLSWWKVNLLKVESFKCEKWNPLYDCEQLKEQAEKFGFKTFTSNNGIKFYSLPEVNQYMVLQDDYGYNFFPLSWDIYEISNLFSLKNEVKKAKFDLQETILNTCKTDKIALSWISKIVENWSNYIVKWTDKFANDVVCKLSLQDGDVKVAKLISLDFSKKIENTTWTILENNEIDESKYLIYKSRWYGFKLYMPKAVKYKSILIKNSLWVSGLTCLQQTNIADWKTWTLKDPELKVLYCKTKLDKESLDKLLETKKDYYKIEKVNWKTFIILYKNTDIAKKILNNLIIN